MNVEADNTTGRILMAVDASAQSYDALEAAAEFASHLKAHLMALFVEDINLFKLAELPFAKELDRSSGVLRPLNPDNVTRALKADARRFERRLSEESEKRRISVSMRVVRGHYTAAALEIADEGDIVFVHNMAGWSYGLTRSMTQFSRPDFTKQPVWVFYDGSRETERGLDLGLSLCSKYGSDLRVVVTPNVDNDELISRLTARLQASGRARYRLLSATDKEGLVGAVQASGGSFLVLPRHNGRTARERDVLARRLDCPRILV